jgi:hypothetical protein
LSEEAKIAYLQEKIKEAKRNEKHGAISIVSAGVFGGAGIIFIVLGNAFGVIETIYAGISLIAICIFMFIFGIYVSLHYEGQYKNLMKELEGMAILNPRCPTCGKELPKGNFAFCPFCGKSLKP